MNTIRKSPFIWDKYHKQHKNDLLYETDIYVESVLLLINIIIVELCKYSLNCKNLTFQINGFTRDIKRIKTVNKLEFYILYDPNWPTQINKNNYLSHPLLLNYYFDSIIARIIYFIVLYISFELNQFRNTSENVIQCYSYEFATRSFWIFVIKTYRYITAKKFSPLVMVSTIITNIYIDKKQPLFNQTTIVQLPFWNICFFDWDWQ